MDWYIVFAALAIAEAFLAFVKTPVSAWLNSESPDRLYFGPPLIDRVRGAMGALAGLGLALSYLHPTGHVLPWLTSLGFVSGIGLMACACSWFVGPRDVYLNLAYRTCERAGGWLFFVKKSTCELTEKSVIYVYGSRHEGHVVLWIAGKGDPKFLLAKARNNDEAVEFAQKICTLAQINVKETTAAAMRGRMSARKRSLTERE